MSRSRSDAPVPEPVASAPEPVEGTLRPADHADSTAEVQQPALGLTGWVRWGWRQLTSMRTALVLLLVMAIAAVPGSIFPQRSADPNGVTQWRANNPELFPVLDKLQLFDVYTSVWFSAIYILLFVSLIGCVIPRTKHHLQALRARPPRTPARLSRLDDHRETLIEVAPEEDPDAVAEASVSLAAAQLRKAGYRVERYDRGGVRSVSAERGYARETGNLVFHTALIGVLISVGIGGGYTYTGQTVIVEGGTFVNSMVDYNTFNPGRFVDPETLTPYALTLESFDVSYREWGLPGAGQAGDFAANTEVQRVGEQAEPGVVRVNHPLVVEGDRIYLMGNGYAPTIVVRNAADEIVFSGSVPFLPQDDNLTSLGIVKVPDGMPEQIGLVGFFYPTAGQRPDGAMASVYPDLRGPMLTLDVYRGDLGIDEGIPRSVYVLDTSEMEKLTGRTTDIESLRLLPGHTADLPDGLGTVTFEAVPGSTGFSDSVKRYVSLSIHRDAAATWVLVFAVLAVLGLLAALFVPRRRMWVKATVSGHTVRLEYAGLARGEDPTLTTAVDQFAQRHGEALRR